MKKTVVIGASPNPARYSYKAIEMLVDNNIDTIPIGLRTGIIKGLTIETAQIPIENVDTVTLYVGPQNQESWMPYILKLKPKRVIFNPGTEDYKNEQILRNLGIEVEHACTLVLLSTQSY